ncbi:phage terminase small subunit [Bacillus sp. J33]|uniref:phage terminase small subunit n=1 Tax=Bacillus sp. J33 TaxID=935836 RepID=UPI0004791212|nr:phage terminase small subunit [Bacillus sp. J33]
MNWDEIRKEFETSKITLKALAEKHDIKIGTLKSRKSREGWSRDPTKKDATKKQKVATLKNKDAPRNRSGNPNPNNQFTKRNKAAEKHGMFSKFLPDETLEIMEQMQEHSPADLIWDQIQIQYAAIIRAQRIMFVESKLEMIKELKKAKHEYYPRSEEDGGGVEQSVIEEEYEFQFAWDRHATFLNAQSRAMGELRSLIKQFEEMTSMDDERRLKLEQLQTGIQKVKKETEFIEERTKLLKGTKKDTGLLESLIDAFNGENK